MVQELGRSPTVAELAAAIGTSEEAILEAMEAGQGYRASSIDAPDEQDIPLSARMGEHDTNFDAVEERALLGPAMSRLPQREQSILRMRFVDGLTQSEIATSIGVSQMHVSRLLATSLTELRRGMSKSDQTDPTS
jgi:RNA polymerase sigma-B factor